jgi:aminopeptidase N
MHIQQCYTQLLYGKGPYVLHALRQEIGDETFKKLLYYMTVQPHKKRMKVSTEDVIQLVNVLTGENYRPWFERYVYGTEVPELEL